MASADKSGKITVLYAHSSADLYGSDVALLNLVSHLPESVRPIVALPEHGPLTDRLRERGIATETFPLAVPRRYYFHPRRVHRLFLLPAELAVCWRRMRNLIEAENVDIVHLNVSILLGPAWVAHRCARPIVWHFREILPEKGAWRDMLIGAAERWAERIPCISNAVRAQFARREKTAVVFDAIVPDQSPKVDPRPLRRELGLPENAHCVGTVGRLNDRKGHDVLIRAAPLVLRHFPQTRFLIVGDVYKKNIAIRKRLERLAADLGVSENVIFAGFRPDVLAILELIDVFVLASKLPDGFGIVQLEAMLKEKPVVATAHGGPLDVVIPGQTGFLVPPNDPESLAAKIIELLANPPLCQSMGRNGRRRVLEHFTIDRQVRQVVDLYKAVLREASRRERS